MTSPSAPVFVVVFCALSLLYFGARMYLKLKEKRLARLLDFSGPPRSDGKWLPVFRWDRDHRCWETTRGRRVLVFPPRIPFTPWRIVVISTDIAANGIWLVNTSQDDARSLALLKAGLIKSAY